MEFGKRHNRLNGLFPAPTWYGHATGKLLWWTDGF